MHLPKIITVMTSLILSCAVHAKPVIYDTDMAIDDWFALLYLEAHPDADLLAVTLSTSGETHCQPGLSNVTNLLKLHSPREVPIACGDAYPLDGYFIFPPAWQKDADTLSGIDLRAWLEQPATEVKSDGHAADLLHKTLQAATEPVTIIAVGPMTNIAQWLTKYPDDISRVEELVIMGGAYEASGNIIVPNFTDNNPNKVSEWNFFIDPIATQQILEADIPKVLVGLDVTNTVRITHGFADNFKNHVNTKASQFADKVFDNNRWFIDSGEYYFWDVMAAIVALNPDLCSGNTIPITGLATVAGEAPYVGSSDLSMPSTNAFGKPRQHLLTATAGQVIDASADIPPTKVCMATNAEAVFAEFIQRLTTVN